MNRILGQANGNNTNIFRIFASIGRGAVKGENGETIEQVSFYAPSRNLDYMGLLIKVRSSSIFQVLEPMRSLSGNGTLV